MMKFAGSQLPALLIATGVLAASSLVVGIGCTFDGGNVSLSTIVGAGDATSSSVTADATPGSLLDADIFDAAPPDAMPCVGTSFGFNLLNLGPCDPGQPTSDFVLDVAGVYQLDTSNGTLTAPDGSMRTLDFVLVPQSGGSELFVTSATLIRIDAGSSLLLGGPRPVVLLSTSNIDISGRLLANGSNSTSGAGGNQDVDCAAGRGINGSAQTSNHNDIGGSGGGGGGFARPGGQGARVNGSVDPAVPGGSSVALIALEPLRGGCAGGSGGTNGGGVGGGAGGAFQLVAAGRITLSSGSVLSVSGGAGGAVTQRSAGGGGGGSAGEIVLQADTLTAAGAMTVNGGGGGEGSYYSNPTHMGQDGSLSDTTPAPGGASSSFSSNGFGGNGATPLVAAENGLEGRTSITRAAGGGGGGGGTGIVHTQIANP